jgi:hypothetical protein
MIEVTSYPFSWDGRWATASGIIRCCLATSLQLSHGSTDSCFFGLWQAIYRRHPIPYARRYGKRGWSKQVDVIPYLILGWQRSV